jgi:hypothetical protein
MSTATRYRHTWISARLPRTDSSSYGLVKPAGYSFCPDFKFLPLLSRFAAAKHKYDSGKYHAQANGQRTLQELSKYYLAK